MKTELFINQMGPRFLTLTIYRVKYWFTKIKVSKYFFPNNLEIFLEVRKIVRNPFLTIYSHVFMEHSKDTQKFIVQSIQF